MITNPRINIFTTLPSELILQIFEFCSGIDLLQLYTTSSKLRNDFMMMETLENDPNHMEMTTIYNFELMNKLLPSRSCYHQAILLISPPGNLIFKIAYYEYIKERAEKACHEMKHEEGTVHPSVSGLNLPSFETNMSLLNGLGYKSVKIACVGPSKSGKTKYVNCVTGQSQFAEDRQGVGAFVRNMQVVFHSYLFQLEIWDIARSKGMERIFMSHSDFVMFCFDLNHVQSFLEMSKMIEDWMIDRFASFSNFELNEHLLENRMYMCIIGMKNDLPRKVTNDMIQQLLNSFSMQDLRNCRIQYFELSTKNNTGMYLPLFHMLRTMENDIA
ncbi:hypothetical protein C9374_013878 [Naegleria lovaniensis]|uniref:F-box domain-containing protein n=1 Tax=Naegleria lovaniensis TaxID=51637 RepID=A0AA88KPD4_NAELO|nr:uncharacterized protein C9374_013878 [Naegleria lovaniensis]KAG2389318.1 hypothetical protein C9374_013878 [Naegleria lovaniensis]